MKYQELFKEEEEYQQKMFDAFAEIFPDMLLDEDARRGRIILSFTMNEKTIILDDFYTLTSDLLVKMLSFLPETVSWEKETRDMTFTFQPVLSLDLEEVEKGRDKIGAEIKQIFEENVVCFTPKKELMELMEKLHRLDREYERISGDLPKYEKIPNTGQLLEDENFVSDYRKLQKYFNAIIEDKYHFPDIDDVDYEKLERVLFKKYDKRHVKKIMVESRMITRSSPYETMIIRHDAPMMDILGQFIKKYELGQHKYAYDYRWYKKKDFHPITYLLMLNTPLHLLEELVDKEQNRPAKHYRPEYLKTLE